MTNKDNPPIAHIPVGYSARGIEVSPPDSDLGYYEREMQGKRSVVPTAAYCPTCSNTKEYNKKSGKMQQKFMMKHSDLSFNLSYEESEDGCLFAKCEECNFDLRYETNQTIANPGPKLQEVYRDILVDNPRYEYGSYYIPTNQFVEGAKAYQSNGRAKLCLKQKIGQTHTIYRLKDTVFANISRLKREKEGLIGVPREYWARV